MTQEQDIKNAVQVLRRGGVILYPTDTVWGIGCDATNEEAVAKVYKIKHRDDSKALICLVDSDARLQRYVRNVPAIAWDFSMPSSSPPRLSSTEQSIWLRTSSLTTARSAYASPKSLSPMNYATGSRKPLSPRVPTLAVSLPHRIIVTSRRRYSTASTMSAGADVRSTSPILPAVLSNWVPQAR